MLIILIYSEIFYGAEKSVNGHLKFHGHVGIGTAHVFLPPFNFTLSCIILKDENSLPFTTPHWGFFPSFLPWKTHSIAFLGKSLLQIIDMITLLSPP